MRRRDKGAGDAPASNAHRCDLRQRGISIRWKLFFSMLIFTSIVLIIVWLFQIFLLNFFYERTKTDELTSGADMIEQHLHSSELESMAHDYAVDNSVCIRVFSVEDKIASEIVSIDVFRDCVIHRASDRMLSNLYTAALENGGWYLHEQEEVNLSVYWGGTKDVVNPRDRTISTVYVRIYTQPETGDEYVIMLNSKITPVRTVTQTLLTQFSWIVFLIVIAAMIVAFALYRVVARPISRMNESAKRLAKGDYQADFSGLGYRETRELAQTLNYAAGELSKADSLQKELIANISHDLRTPLTMIKGYSEMMRDIPGENSPENMQVIIDETVRLSELVNDLLDISRLQAGTRTLEKQHFDLTQTIFETMDRYEKLTARDGYCIRFFSDRHVDIHADRSMILQVVYNIINNAINHSGEDKVVLVRQTVENGVVRISVEDHGEGIEPEQLPYIWDRYYKVDRVHRMATVGTGLGLSIVKNILEMHGAQYGVESTVGRGSMFWFSLPVCESSPHDEQSMN